MKRKSIGFILVLILLGFTASAVEIRCIEEDLTETGHYSDDYLFFGESLDFQGNANDLFVFTEQLIFSGSTPQALFGFADTINFSGKSANGIKTVSRKITISGKIIGTSFMAGERVLIESTGQIAGDTFVAARKFNIKGSLVGNIKAAAAEIFIDNEITGDITVYTGQLTIGETGKINGNLTYYSDQEITAEEAARVTGEIIFEKKEGRFFGKEFDDDFMKAPFWLKLLFQVAFLVFGLLMLLFPFMSFLDGPVTRKEVMSHALWGLIPIFIYPTAILISLALIITIPVGVFLILSLLPIIMITKLIGITAVGGLMINGLQIRLSSRWAYFLIGGVLYSLLSLIPILGCLLLIVVCSIGCGVLLFAAIKKRSH